MVEPTALEACRIIAPDDETRVFVARDAECAALTVEACEGSLSLRSDEGPAVSVSEGWPLMELLAAANAMPVDRTLRGEGIEVVRLLDGLIVTDGPGPGVVIHEAQLGRLMIEAAHLLAMGAWAARERFRLPAAREREDMATVMFAPRESR